MDKFCAKPFLRWAGSKRKLLPHLLEFTPKSFTRYVEPFAGSACLFFCLNPKKALLGDINRELIRTYIELKYRLQEVVAELEKLNCSKEDYYLIRSWNPEDLSVSKQAARFIYLNRFCFNGLYRTNRSGRFNVPYGAERAGSLPSEKALQKCSRLLKKAVLKTSRFEKLLTHVKEGDFVYLDPPYSVRSRRVFNEYAPDHFNEQDLQALRDGMISLNRRGIRFLVSYADSAEANYLKKGFSSTYVEVRRHIAGFAGNRRKSREVLIHNG